MLLLASERDWFTQPEILKRANPLGIRRSQFRFTIWKLCHRLRWLDQRMRSDAHLSGRRADGRSARGVKPRDHKGSVRAVYDYRLTAVGRAERRALAEFMQEEFLAPPAANRLAAGAMTAHRPLDGLETPSFDRT